MTGQTIVEGFVLGISTGTICLMTCTPIYLPYLLTEKRSLGHSMSAVFEISLGRFFSYLTFGALAGFTGSNISTINRGLFTGIAYILLSLYLILTTVRTHRAERKCSIPKASLITKSGFLLGIFTGINFCPSFLISLSKAVNLGGAIDGMLLFLGFFVGTTIYLIPLGFLGSLSHSNYMKLTARIASLLIACWFIFSGIKQVADNLHIRNNSVDESRIVDIFAPGQRLILIASDEKQYFVALADSLIKNNSQVIKFSPEDFLTQINTITMQEDFVILADFNLKISNLTDYFDNYDCIFIEENYPILPLIRFLKSHTFKTGNHLKWDVRKQN
ncbi:MAG: sulfite exporter TauE/SafE family protein [Candidatus Cloacimonetes bacterium]|nr:sulfite exporter TauE/SafE family protein [Candidatus Cloacimonadota bacterium]